MKGFRGQAFAHAEEGKVKVRAFRFTDRGFRRRGRIRSWQRTVGDAPDSPFLPATFLLQVFYRVLEIQAARKHDKVDDGAVNVRADPAFEGIAFRIEGQ